MMLDCFDMDLDFSWLAMAGNYNERKVDNFKNDLFCVDTVLVTDREQPYETAISHKDFNYGDWVILGWRNTKEEAQAFHDEVVDKFLKDNGSIMSITDVYDGIEYYRKQNAPTDNDNGEREEG